MFKFESLKYKRILSSILLVLLPTLSCKSNQKTSSQSESKPDGKVEVKGNAKDEGPVEYTQDSDSVSIGGTNLTTTGATYSITATLINSTGSKQIYSGQSDSSSFSFKVIASGYVRVDVTTNDKTLSAILPPSFVNSGTTTAYVTVDRTTSIAAKIMTIIADKSASGDIGAKSALDQWAIPISDLYIVASSARRAVDNDATVIASPPVINLSDIAAKLVVNSNKKVSDLSSEMSSNEYAAKISATAQEVTFGSDGLTYPPRVLAYRTGADLGTSTAAMFDVAYNTIISTTNVYTIGAYQTEANFYRKSTSNSTAAAAEPQVQTTYTQVYSSCQTNSATCVDTAAPVATAQSVPLPSSSSYTTGTTTGTTTGSTTGSTIVTQCSAIGEIPCSCMPQPNKICCYNGSTCNYVSTQ